MYHYSAFNLGISSPLELPLMPVAENGTDVVITLGSCDPQAGPPPAMDHAFHVTPRFATLDYAGVGTLTVRDGRKLCVRLLPGADESRLPGLLTGAALAVLLYQRGLLVLKASAVAVNGAAVVLMAGSGRGKSTLAAKLCQQGHRLLADDITAIDISKGPPRVIPAAPLLKLDPQIAAALGLAHVSVPGVSGNEGKEVFLVENSFAATPTPIGAVYHLFPGSDNNIGYIPLQAGLTAVSYHSYPGCLLQPSTLDHLRQYSRLVGAVPVCELTRRGSLDELAEQAQMIVDHVAAHQQNHGRRRLV